MFIHTSKHSTCSLDTILRSYIRTVVAYNCVRLLAGEIVHWKWDSLRCCVCGRMQGHMCVWAHAGPHVCVGACRAACVCGRMQGRMYVWAHAGPHVWIYGACGPACAHTHMRPCMRHKFNNVCARVQCAIHTIIHRRNTSLFITHIHRSHSSLTFIPHIHRSHSSLTFTTHANVESRTQSSPKVFAYSRRTFIAHIHHSHWSLTFTAHIHRSQSSLTIIAHIHRSHSPRIQMFEPRTQSSQKIFAYSRRTFIAHIHRSHSSLTFIAHIHRSHSSLTFIPHIHSSHSPRMQMFESRTQSSLQYSHIHGAHSFLCCTVVKGAVQCIALKKVGRRDAMYGLHMSLYIFAVCFIARMKQPLILQLFHRWYARMKQPFILQYVSSMVCPCESTLILSLVCIRLSKVSIW